MGTSSKATRNLEKFGLNVYPKDGVREISRVDFPGDHTHWNDVERLFQNNCEQPWTKEQVFILVFFFFFNQMLLSGPKVVCYENKLKVTVLYLCISIIL